MIVRELITKLGFQLNQGQLNKAEQATARIKDRANDAANAFRNIAVAFASFSTFKSLISIGDEMQSLRSQVSLLPQVLGDAGVAVDLLVDKANNARQSIDEYGRFFVKAGNATKDFITDQEELLRIVDGAAFGIAASGSNAVNQKQAFYQLGQAIGSPVVQMEEMNTLIDAAPDLFRELGRVIPGANGNLRKLIGTGTVTGKVLAEALQKVAVVFEDRMKKIPMTVSQAITIVGNKFRKMIDRMNRESMFITRIADGILKAFDKIEYGVTKVVDALGGFDTVLRLIGIAMLVAFSPAIVSAFVAAFGWLVAGGLEIILVVAAIAFALEDLYVWIQGGESIIGDAIGPWSKYSVAVMAVFEMIGDAISTTWDLLLAFGHIFTGAFTLDIEQLKYGWNNAAQILWNIISGALANIKKSIQDVLSLIGIDISGGWSLGKSGAGTGTAFAPPSQSAFAPQAGAGMVNNQTTNVSVTVPPGTPQEQVSFIDRAAKQSFSDMNKPLRAIDMGVHAQ